MGSAPSTPNEDSRQTNDPWWPIENQNLALNHTSNSNLLATPTTTYTRTLSTRRDTIAEGHRSNSVATVDISSTINNNTSSSHLNNTRICINNNNNNTECSAVESDCNNQRRPRPSRPSDLLLFDMENTDGRTESSVDHGDDSHAGNAERRRASREERINQNLEEFKEELRVKREKRQNAIADLRNEITTLRQQLADERALNRQLKNSARSSDGTNSSMPASTTDIDDNGQVTPNNDSPSQTNSDGITLKTELAEAQFALQLANAEILSLNTELTGTRRQVTSLKDVVAVTKQMVQIREDQLAKVCNIYTI